ncbi:MAG: trypsin-like peptidase domain-containing protein [Planctomycetota bacterium]|nr:trypsin-like peptidase domain-containing protein [Planctomycetota bacterium]
MSLFLCALSLQLVPAVSQDDVAFQRRMTPTVKVVQAVRPAVVHVLSNTRMRGWDLFRRPVDRNVQGFGSGVVIFEEGYIVTNYHVVRGAERIEVRFDPSHDEALYPAKLISYNAAEDLALLKIEGEKLFPTVPLGRSSDLMIGETVVAIGNPYGQTLSVSSGIISGLHRDVQVEQPGGLPRLSFGNLIQTDASINPGNSGGPLLNVNGELIGINTVMNTAAENIGFAIPVDQVKRVLRDHLLAPSAARGWLGFDVDPTSMKVVRVDSSGPGDRAGLEVGDRIVSLGGVRIETPEDYTLARLDVMPGDDVRVRVRRGLRNRDLDVRAWDRVDGLAYERAGLTVEQIIVNRRRHVRLTSVRPDGPAAALGLQRHDIIDAVRPIGAGWPARRITSPDDFSLLLSRLQPGTRIQIEIWRDEDGDGVLERRNPSELYKGTLEIR